MVAKHLEWNTFPYRRSIPAFSVIIQKAVIIQKVLFFLILSYKRVASIGLCLSYRVTLFYLFSGKEQLILVSIRVKEINILYLLYSRKNS